MEAISVSARAPTCTSIYSVLHIASGTVKKVIEINRFLLGTMAGGAGKY